ncbi:MAG TPA: hypothetical protein VFX78_08665 [Candidatus Eisenbacteria bacterium]|jgi:hypothetical protein|nr:hypothetical protein [Candidatus Eisenbacteria bacterium]
MIRILRASAIGALLLAALGAQCNTAPNAPIEQGFVQTVRVEPAQPHRGEQLRVWSKVTNRGVRPKWGTFMDCGLGLGGDLALSEVPGTARCQSPSFERQLGPGESVEMADTKVVDSPAGTYVLEVQHLIGPRMTQKVTVHVSD